MRWSHGAPPWLAPLLLLASSRAHYAGARSVHDHEEPVILISMDGFKADYFDMYAPPTLQRLAAHGVRSELKPAFTTKTFPNHWTLVTGVFEETHGIIANAMYDPDLNSTFSMATTDPRWWNRAEPVWVTAEKVGVRTGTYFWPGSEVKLEGVRPSRWMHFDSSVPFEERVSTVLEWLSAKDAPRLVTLYFEEPDSAGHRYGPESEEVREAVLKVDAAIGMLIEGLEKRRTLDQTNLVITADHGMTALSPERVIRLYECAPNNASHPYVLTADTPTVNLWPRRAEDTEPLLAKLKACHPNLTAWSKEEVPERFHFRRSNRVPPIVALADEGWTVCSSAERCSGCCGNHGFDNELHSMHPIFVAHGPAFRRGFDFPVFSNVHVQALLCRLLGIIPQKPANGTVVAVAPMLVEFDTEGAGLGGGNEDGGDTGPIGLVIAVFVSLGLVAVGLTLAFMIKRSMDKRREYERYAEADRFSMEMTYNLNPSASPIQPTQSAETLKETSATAPTESDRTGLLSYGAL